MEQFADLGSVAVMDAERLVVGSYVDIDGQVLVVDRIVGGIHVYFRPLTRWELVRYRCTMKVIVIALSVIILIVGINFVIVWTGH
jgi:hypothetical protein